MTTTDTQISPQFDHEKNITVGQARVIYVPDRGYRKGGWVLPGGVITTDEWDAQAYAVRMNRLMSGQSVAKVELP